jgi:hypothetical protein
VSDHDPVIRRACHFEDRFRPSYGCAVCDSLAQETPYTPVKLCKSQALRVYGLQQKATVFTPAYHLNLYKREDIMT